MLSEDEKMVKFKLLDMFLFYICLFKKPFKLEFAEKMKNYKKNLEIWEHEMILKGNWELISKSRAFEIAKSETLNDLIKYKTKNESATKKTMDIEKPDRIKKSKLKKELTSELSSESEAEKITKKTKPKEKDS